MSMLWNPTRFGPTSVPVDPTYQDMVIDRTLGANGYVLLRTASILEARKLGNLSLVWQKNFGTSLNGRIAILPNGNIITPRGKFDSIDGTKLFNLSDLVAPIYDDQLGYIIGTRQDELTAYDAATGTEQSWGSTQATDLSPEKGFATSNNRVWVVNDDKLELFDISDGSHIKTDSTSPNSTPPARLHTTANYCYTYVNTAQTGGDIVIRKWDESGTLVARETLNGANNVPQFGDMSGDGSIYVLYNNTNNDTIIASLNAGDLTFEFESILSGLRGTGVMANVNNSATFTASEDFYVFDTNDNFVQSIFIDISPDGDDFSPYHVPTGRLLVVAPDSTFDDAIRSFEYDVEPRETWDDAKTRPYHLANSRIR